MILEWKGSRRSKAATVFGRRLGLQLALERERAGGDAQHARDPLRATGSAAAGRPSVRARPRRRAAASVLTRARSRRPIQGEIGWRYCRSSAASTCSARRSTSARSASAPTSSPRLPGHGSARPQLRTSRWGDARQLEAAAVVALAASSTGQRRLAARDPAPRREEVRRPSAPAATASGPTSPSAPPPARLPQLLPLRPATAAAARTSPRRRASTSSSLSTGSAGRLAGDVDAARARLGNQRDAAAAPTWTMCSAQPVSPAKSIARPIASSSATTGREARKRGRARPPRARARVSASFSACTATSSRAARSAACPRTASRRRRAENSSMPLSDMNALKPIDAALGKLLELSRFPGTRPPQRPKSTNEAGLARPSLRSKRRRRSWAGCIQRHVEERGDAARGQSARVPVAIPSQSVRPGLVEVHVGVDPAGEEVQPPRVDLLRPAVESGAIAATTPSSTRGRRDDAAA